MADILSLLAERPIAYHRPLIRKFGLAPGIFLGQVLFWQGKGSKGQWVYKTQEEMKEETCLSRRNQETARKKLIAAGVLEEELRGIPARLYFRVNLTVLAKTLGISSLAETSKLDGTKAPNSGVRNRQTITENTQENTTERAPEAARPLSVEVWRQTTRRYPPKEIWSDVENCLGASPDEVKLQRVYKEWILCGNKPTNYRGIMDWYKNGIPPPNGNHKLPTQAEMNAGGRGKLVL